MSLRVSDHALIRFLERAGGLDVEGLRAALAKSFDRAEEAARLVGLADYTIAADGLRYLVRAGVVVTILDDCARPPLVPDRPGAGKEA